MRNKLGALTETYVWLSAIARVQKFVTTPERRLELLRIMNALPQQAIQY